MDFVHDTLADGRPFRILTVVDNWSRSSPVREAGFRMSGELVSQVLDRVLGEGQRPRSITVDLTPSEFVTQRQEEPTAEEAVCSGYELSRNEANVRTLKVLHYQCLLDGEAYNRLIVIAGGG
jgi:hypothetical protein